jgi:hypothetical protein
MTKRITRRDYIEQFIALMRTLTGVQLNALRFVHFKEDK